MRLTDACLDAVAYYLRATQKREHEGLPCHGLCSDRRQLSQSAEAMHSENVKSYVCLCCAQIRTWVRDWECAYDCSDEDKKQMWRSFVTCTDIRMMSVERSLWRMHENIPTRLSV